MVFNPLNHLTEKRLLVQLLLLMRVDHGYENKAKSHVNATGINYMLLSVAINIERPRLFKHGEIVSDILLTELGLMVYLQL